MNADRIRITGTAQRLTPAVHLAETTSGSGEVRFLWFPLGLPTMDEEDWRQFEITPENARKMVDEANAALSAGEEIWINYGHDEWGARAGDAVRFDLASDGVYGTVVWNDRARAAIKATPPEYKYFSPEFYALRVQDEQGMTRLVNGRDVLQPFEIEGGGLTNVPAMEKLAVAASRNHNPAPAQADARKETGMLYTPAFLKSLDLPDGAGPEQIEAAVAKKLAATKPADPPDVKAAVREEMVAQREEIRKEVRAELEKENAERAKKARVEALMTAASEQGKVIADNREALQAVCAANPDGFEKLMASLPVLSPVTTRISSARVEADLGDSSDSAVLHQKVKAHQAAAAKEGRTVSYRDALTAVAPPKAA